MDVKTLVLILAIVAFLLSAAGVGRVGWRDVGFALVTLSLII